MVDPWISPVALLRTTDRSAIDQLCTDTTGWCHGVDGRESTRVFTEDQPSQRQCASHLRAEMAPKTNCESHPPVVEQPTLSLLPRTLELHNVSNRAITNSHKLARRTGQVTSGSGRGRWNPQCATDTARYSSR